MSRPDPRSVHKIGAPQGWREACAAAISPPYLTVSGLLVALLVACTPHSAPAPSGGPCGMSPGDWCPSPPGDPCGAHHDVASCKADARCVGMRYSGESVVACAIGADGFATNCPTVGCVSR